MLPSQLQTFVGRSPKGIKHKARRFRLHPEPLEDRNLLAVTVSITAENLYRAGGSTTDTLLSSRQLATLLVDTERDGFGDLYRTVDSFTADDDDLLIERIQTSTGSIRRTLTFELTDGIDPGDPLMLVFYDRAHFGGILPPGPGAGVPFNFYRSDLSVDGSDPWVVPAEGTSAELKFLTESAGGSQPEIDGETSRTTADTLVEINGDGLLEINDLGDNSTDDITLSVVNGGSHIRIHDPTTAIYATNGVTSIDPHTAEVPIADITSAHGILVNTRRHNDSLTIDYSGGPFQHSINYESDNGPLTAQQDKLFIRNGTFDSATFRFDDEGMGGLELDGDLISYLDVDIIDPLFDSTDLTVELTDLDEFELVDIDGVGPGLTRFVSDEADQVTLRNPSETLTLLGRGGDDIVDVKSFGEGFDALFLFDGQESDRDLIKLLTPLTVPAGTLAWRAEKIEIRADITATGDATIDFLAGDSILANSATITVDNGDLKFRANPLKQEGVLASDAVTLAFSTLRTEGSGDLLFEGNGSARSGRGVVVQRSVVESVSTMGAAGEIRFNGNGTADDPGVHLINFSEIRTVEGLIRIEGTTIGDSLPGQGVHIEGDSIIETMGTANIEISAENPPSPNGREGIRVGDATIRSSGDAVDAGSILLTATSERTAITLDDALLTSDSGDISLTGTSPGRPGVYLIGNSQIVSTGIGPTAAEIEIEGSGDFRGIEMRESFSIESVDGDIQLNGVGIRGPGIFATSFGDIKSTGDARIMMNGTTGERSISRQAGVRLGGGTVESIAGDISIIGSSSAISGDRQVGVELNNELKIRSTGSHPNAARITIQGTGGDSDDDNYGVLIEDRLTRVESVDGDILIEGTGGGNGNGDSSVGVRFIDAIGIHSIGTTEHAAKIRIHGDGNVQADGFITSAVAPIEISGEGVGILGTVGNAGGSSQFDPPITITGTVTGVSLTDALIRTIDQSITIAGANSGASAASPFGVSIYNSRIETRNGPVTIEGTAGQPSTNPIVRITGFSSPSGIFPTSDAPVLITAHQNNGSSNGRGVFIDSRGYIGSGTYNGPVTIVTDSIDFRGEVETHGNVHIKPVSVDTSIGLGAGAGELRLHDSELRDLGDGFASITIGDPENGTGHIEVAVQQSSGNVRDPLNLFGGSIHLAYFYSNDVSLSLNASEGPITGAYVEGSETRYAGNVSPGYPGFGIADVIQNEGNAVLADDSSLTLDFTGTAHNGGSIREYERVSVDGTFSIEDRVTLHLNPADDGTGSLFVPTIGDRFTIARRQGGSGDFADLPEGGVVANFLGSGLFAKITYEGGDGDDIVLTVIDPKVVDRHIFYNNSAYDGDPGASSADDAAIATDKQALLSGEGPATFANYTSAVQGITGIMIDIADLPASYQFDPQTDFTFRVGNNNDSGSWRVLTGNNLPEVSIRQGVGNGGSDRVSLIWPAGSNVGQWLEVTLHAKPEIGLIDNDVFYFGNAPGETGNQPDQTTVDAIDFVMARGNLRNFLDPAEVTDRFDFNRDQRVNAADLLTVRDYATTSATSLRLINPAVVTKMAETGELVLTTTVPITDLPKVKRAKVEEREKNSARFDRESLEFALEVLDEWHLSILAASYHQAATEPEATSTPQSSQRSAELPLDQVYPAWQPSTRVS